MTTPLTADPNREAELVEVLLAYVEARQVGREPDRAELLAAHPNLRDDLEEFFASHDDGDSWQRLTGGLPPVQALVAV